MTLEEYLALITSEHSDKPIYIATLTALLQPAVYIYDQVGGLPEKFDLDTAVGAQLDVVGEWVGRSRFIGIPLTGVYFAWDDTVQTGWDSGVWQGQFDPDSGLTILPDDSYRRLLKAKIAANHWDGTIPGAYAAWEEVFDGDSIIVIQDNQDMSMTVGIAGDQLDIVSQALLINGYIPLKPEGVRVNYYIISVDDGPLFAWDVQNSTLDGWEIGSWGKELSPV